MEPVPSASWAQKCPPAQRHRGRSGLPRQQLRAKISSLSDRGKTYIDRIKAKASAPIQRQRRLQQEKVSPRSTQSSGSWASPLKPDPPAHSDLVPKTLHEDLAKLFKLLDPTSLTHSQPGMKRSSTLEPDDARKRTKRKDDVADDAKGVELRLPEWTKRIFLLQKTTSPTESSDSPELSNLGSQFDNTATGRVPPPSPVEGVPAQDPGCTLVVASETQEAEQERPLNLPSPPPEPPTEQQTTTVKEPVRQSTQSSVGRASTVDLSERRLSDDSLSATDVFADTFSRPQSTVSTAPSAYDSPSRAVSQLTARQALAKKAMSSSCSLNNPLDPILLWDTQGADPVEFPLGDDWVLAAETISAGPVNSSTTALVYEPVDITACQVAEPSELSDKDKEMSRDMARLKLCDAGPPPERPDSEICDIDLNPGLSPHQTSSSQASDANARRIRLVIRRASVQAQPINDTASSSAPDASPMSLQPPNSRQPEDLTANNSTTERRPSLSTISEGYSDPGFSPKLAMSPTMPSNASRPGEDLVRIVSQASLTPSGGSRSAVESRFDREASPHESQVQVQVTPATSVADPIEVDVEISDSEDEDDDSVTTEETDESLVEAFVATALDPRLLRVTMALKDRIRLLVLSRVAAWIQSARGYGEESQEAPGSDQAPGNNNSNNDSGGWASSSGNANSPNSKRSLEPGNGDGAGGREDDDQDKRPRVSGESSRRPPKEQIPRLACPWAKRYPEHAIPACQAGFPSVHRTKEHLYRIHQQPIHCKRCFTVFKTLQELGPHSRLKIPCELQEDHPGFRGIDEVTKEKLRSRKDLKSVKEEPQRWERMWNILFPGIECPSPYYDLSCIENVISPRDRERYREFLRRELPDRIISDILTGIRRSNLGDSGPNAQRELSQIVVQAVWDAFDVVLPSLLPNEVPSQIPSAQAASPMGAAGQGSSGPSFSQGDGTQGMADMNEFSDLSFLLTGMGSSSDQDLSFGNTPFIPEDWPQQPDSKAPLTE